MKSRLLLALPLAAALAFPALAQDTQSTQPNNPASANQQTPTDQQAQQPQSSASQPVETGERAAQLEPLTYQKHEGFWGHLNPFARKKYVQRQLSPIRDRMNELDDLTAKNANAIKDVDQRATTGIQAADQKASLADQHAIDAGNKATQAQQTAQAADQKLTTVSGVVNNIDQFTTENQIELRFRPGQMVLSQKSKAALDDLATNLKDQHGYIIEVQGFSSGKGMAAVQNSQKMSDAVVRYLVLNHDIPVWRIYTLGLGNTPVPASTEGEKARRTTGGRVEVSLMKNQGLAGMQPAASNSTPQGDQQAALKADK